MENTTNAKLWGGRFQKETSKDMDSFNSSISFDCRLYKQDIAGSIAHAKMLAKQGIISIDEGRLITDGLSTILNDIECGNVEFETSAEDIHMNVEKLLTERIGEAGKKLHTGRSRNDQVALDMKMFAIQAAQKTILLLLELEEALLSTAQKHTQTVMPGYTHLQKAQPITFAHHIMAYFEMFHRDIERFKDMKKRADYMPLGSGALASTTYPLDRGYVASLLGFSNITANSMDGVSDRDYLVEYMSASSICMMHLSRFSEEIILWSTGEFSFVELDDAYSTGSSIMPQKKNPDAAELIRGKTGRVYGSLFALLTALKGIPLAYNKDMQEDKEAFFNSFDTLCACLSIFTKMFSTLTVNKDSMSYKAALGFTNATDAADYLVGKGLPFRDAHEVSGKLVAYCIANSKTMRELTIEEMRGFCSLIDVDIYSALDIMTCVERRALPGGPAKTSVEKHIEDSKLFIKNNKF